LIKLFYYLNSDRIIIPIEILYNNYLKE
jgi:hypothetical protein